MGKAHARTPAQQRYVAIDRILRAKSELRRTFEKIVAGVSDLVPKSDLNKKWSTRQIRRDIKEMREAGAPIATKVHKDGYSNTHEVYYYADANYRWPDIGFDQHDLLSLKLAQAILEPYRNLPAVQHLSELAERVEEHIQAKDGHTPTVPLYFSPVANLEIKPEIWEAVLEAATEKKYLCATYSGWAEQSLKEYRRLAPYAIVSLEGEWYVVGTAQLQDDSLRQFKLSRFRSAKVTKLSFKVPGDFDIHGILDNTFGKFIGNTNDMVNIRVRFNKRVALLVSGNIWHPKQKIRKCKNRDITLSFPVSKAGPWPYYHVKKWILSWGADAEVVAPKELKELVIAEVGKMAKR